jgi:hypothetical protein
VACRVVLTHGKLEYLSCLRICLLRPAPAAAAAGVHVFFVCHFQINRR